MSDPIYPVMASLHTVICSNDCSLKHNDLVLALQESTNLADGGNFEGGTRRTGWESQRRSLDFKRCLDRLLDNNWNKNSDVPEPLDKLRYPLVHICCLLGKPKALEFLVNDRDFDPAVKCSRTGETALHVTLRHFYGIYRSPRSQMEVLNRLGNNECVAMFEKLVCILTSPTDRILHLKDCISRESVFHLAATKRTEASKELLSYRNKESLFKRGQGDKMQEIKFENERNFYDQCLRLLATKLDDNAGLEVLRFDTNRRGQTVLDILVQDQSPSARETLQFLANKFHAIHVVLLGSGNVLFQPSKHDDNVASSAGTSQETYDQETQEGNQQAHSEPPVSSSPELLHPTVSQSLKPDSAHRVDLHEGVMIKIEYDESQSDACAAVPQPNLPQSNNVCSQQSAHSTLRDLLSKRRGLSGATTSAVSNSTLAAYAASLSMPSTGFHSQHMNCETSDPSSAGLHNMQSTYSASVLSPFLELIIKEGVELDEATHNNIVNAIQRKCSQKLSDIDSKMSAIGEQSVSNEKEINERFFLVQKKKAQMDEVRKEIVLINRQIATLKTEMERKVEMGKMLQLEVFQLEQDLNKTKEFGGALELKRKQLSEEQRQLEGKLSLCGAQQSLFSDSPVPQKKAKN